MDYNFVEVMRHFERMCNKYDYICDIDECPVARLIDAWEKEHNETWDRDCVFYGMKHPEEFAREVVEWAEANKEPIYPTIKEVFDKLCELTHIGPAARLTDIYDTRISEEAADFFGIKPINEDKLV